MALTSVAWPLLQEEIGQAQEAIPTRRGHRPTAGSRLTSPRCSSGTGDLASELGRRDGDSATG